MSGMINYPFPEKTYSSLESSISTLIDLGINTCLLFPPQYGKDHRIGQIWTREMFFNQEERIKVFYIDLENKNYSSSDEIKEIFSESLGNPKNLREHLLSLSQKNKVIFFINYPEDLLIESINNIFNYLKIFYYLAPDNIHFVCAYSLEVDMKEFFNYTSRNSIFFQRVIQIGYYSDEEIRFFINSLLIKWKRTLSEEIKDYIIDIVGGQAFLCKRALSIILETDVYELSEIKKLLDESPNFLIQVKYFINRIPKKMKNLLSIIANQRQIPDNSSVNLKYLLKIGLIIEKETDYDVKSLVLKDYFLNSDNKTINQINLINKSIELSKREKRILVNLLKSDGKILSRDALAEIIWKDDVLDKYSEWAIDKAISRIRKKLNSSKLPDINLETCKRKGIKISS